jgi:hypothetical protein
MSSIQRKLNLMLMSMVLDCVCVCVCAFKFFLKHVDSPYLWRNANDNLLSFMLPKQSMTLSCSTPGVGNHGPVVPQALHVFDLTDPEDQVCCI